MTLRKLFISCFMLLCKVVLSQTKPVLLDEVIVSDLQLKNFSQTKQVNKINDSVIAKNQSSLTSLLNYNSSIYFKENGLGMVSSPSFRGTTAQQTAVIWNGININSQLTGQTDFNTISVKNFDNIAIRAGGGSTIYGTSAIGGSIHLNNDFEFKNKIVNTLNANYGSFNTFGINYKLQASTSKWSSQFGFSKNSSDNDYKYLGTNLKNENGQFYNSSFSTNVAYKLDKSNVIKLYSQFFDAERHFSGTLAAVSKSKYQDFNTRNLLEWDWFSNAISSKTKIAFLSEKYKYFEDNEQPNFTFGKSETFIAKHDLVYKLSSKLQFNSVVDYTQTKGLGSSLSENKRQIGSFVLLIKHQILEKLAYEITFRKEITNNYKSPFLYSFGTKFDACKHYNLKLNLSRNFRIPTFNDLYWQPGGNLNLKPENAYQLEFGQSFIFKNFQFSTTGFYNKIDDLITWQPNISGFWQPQNTRKVNTYGIESALTFDKKLGKHNINFNANYAYTISENSETGEQLIYVPFHKLTGSLAYSYKKATIFTQFLYNGKVFTSSDNFYKLKENKVINAGFDYNFGKQNVYEIGFQIQNILDEKYQNVSMRPMPGRNFNINLILKL